MSRNNSINSFQTNNNNSSISSESKSKKIRKDAKGNIILKKERQKLKSKFHAHLIDNLDPKKELAHVIEIESYKKYNLEDDTENIEDNASSQEDNMKICEERNEVKQKCCNIF